MTPGKGGSLQQQLREQIATAILNGNIPVDSPLPSSRKLAQQLNVARNTVVLAYEHLLDDGYLLARERSGYYVNPDILNGQVKLDVPSRQEVDIPATQIDWANRFKLRPSEQSNIVKPRDWQSYDYPLFTGSLIPRCFRQLTGVSVAGMRLADRRSVTGLQTGLIMMILCWLSRSAPGYCPAEVSGHRRIRFW
ncbi:winged helix-turn-helix domain-containing protein [Aliamphritea spongicola]|nr:winged helix-turn-helix domain-containing protein [Aliamphritea spongicola]